MKHSIKFAGKIVDSKWDHFLWIVTINDQVFHYKTGLGHFTSHRDKYGDTKWGVKKPVNSLLVQELHGWAHVPKLDDILCCLFRDAQAGQESFDSFCDDFGYSNDSLAALDVYRACAEMKHKLAKAFGPLYQVESTKYLEMEY